MLKGIFRKHSSHSGATEPQSMEEPASLAGNEITVETIARRAYELWVERGCPEGTPEVDWFCAEQELGVAGKSAEECGPPRAESGSGAGAAG